MSQQSPQNETGEDRPTLTCPRCEFANVGTAQFCSMCGQPLEPGDLAAGDQSVAPDQSPSAVTEGAEVERSTLGQITKLFVIPLLIVGIIFATLQGLRMVGCITFGGQNSPQQNLQIIAEGIRNGWGEPGLGRAVSPRDQRVLRAAQNFALQIEQIEDEGRRGSLAGEVEQLLDRLDRQLDESSGPGGNDENRTLRSFLVLALGRLGQAESVEPILQSLQFEGDFWSRHSAIMALRRMKQDGRLDGMSRSRMNEIAAAVARRIYDEEMMVQLLAVQSAGHLVDKAGPPDPRVIRPLEEAVSGRMGEIVAWNAAVSLMHLGIESSAATKMVREQLLSRPFLESVEPRQLDGQKRKLDAGWVQQILVYASDAAARSGDPAFLPVLRQLRSDESVAVRSAAARAINQLENG
jgi:hypothetical protein